MLWSCTLPLISSPSPSAAQDLCQVSIDHYHLLKKVPLGLPLKSCNPIDFVYSNKSKRLHAIAVKGRGNVVEGSSSHWIGGSRLVPDASSDHKKLKQKTGKNDHHLWKKRDSAGSGQKALNLVRIVSKLPNQKRVVCGALDKWIAWETEFPLIAVAKALGILRRRNQWLQLIQVTKWMLSKGQGQTMGTYDMLLLAFDKDGRVDEAETVWNMLIETHTRSMPKRLFSRMIALYDHHHMLDKIVEVFADMEELGVKPDEDTVRRVARAFLKLGQEDKQIQVLKKYESKWKYLHFHGERVRVRKTTMWDD